MVALFFLLSDGLSDATPLSGTSVKDSPYQAPTERSRLSERSQSTGNLPFVFLIAALATTLLFATINAIEESLPTHLFTLKVVLAAGISQLPGIILAAAHWHRPSRLMAAFLRPAYIVATTGVLAYAAYALNGRADSFNSAAHMHVIMFPILHCIFAIFLYVSLGVSRIDSIRRH